MPRRYLDIDVLEAARARIRQVFDRFSRVCVSFSGGKDSTCMLHLVADEARLRGRKFALLFVDWEAQYRLTIEHVTAMASEYSDVADLWWMCVPLKTTNAVSQIEPEWISWELGKEDRWVREKPPFAKGGGSIPFYKYPMTFEEFMPAFASFYAGGTDTAFLIGIRCSESKGRWYAVAAGERDADEERWLRHVGDHAWNAYPIYDWKTEDDWTYLGRERKAYNALYDRMLQAGIPPHSMRICEPYGYEQRRSLWLFQVVEPETWARVVARVSGANAGALYAKTRGSVLGNGRSEKPASMNWMQFARFLLDTMPPSTATHYENKIAVWRKFYGDQGIVVADELPTDWKKDGPSWRRVCRTLLRNDYWCRGIGFSPTKTDAYDRYLAIMKRRRASWGAERVASG